MKRNYPIVLALLALLMAACNQTDNKTTIPLDEIPAIVLEGETITLSPEPLAPRQIYDFDDRIVLYDDKTPGAFLYFYSKADGTLTDKFGVIGRGPGEFLLPQVNVSAGGIDVTGVNKRFVHLSPAGDPFLVEERPYPADNDLQGANFLAMLPDSSLLFSSPSIETQFARKQGTHTEGYDFLQCNYPSNVDRTMAKEGIFSNHCLTSPDGTRLFIAYLYYPTVVTVPTDDLSRASITELSTGKKNRIKFTDGRFFLDPVMNYTFTAASDDDFFALFQNDVREQVRNGSAHSEIHRFDSSGRPVCRYLLGRTVYHFTVSADGTTLYTLEMDADGSRLTRWLLPR